jgi:hypothetical protein
LIIFNTEEYAMYKLASVTLSAALGVAGLAHSVTAEAHPYVSVGIGFPRVAVVEPFAYAPGYYAPYHYGYGRDWLRDYDRDRDDHLRRHWDHDRDHWDRR